jgi:MATE family multidrug resistance protein
MRLGLPAATQILMEIGAFGAAAMLAGRLAPEALAAHQIALNCAGVSYMIPLGISSASAVSVGQAIGQKEPNLARLNGYIGMGLACLFVSCSAVAFLVLPRWILSFYTNDEAVLNLGVKLLAIAALFQLFDGIQTVATGALRGLGNTKLPMVVNFCGYWLFGLPIGYVLCFQNHFGVTGLWWGLTMALVVISIILLLAWEKQSRTLQVVGSP